MSMFCYQCQETAMEMCIRDRDQGKQNDNRCFPKKHTQYGHVSCPIAFMHTDRFRPIGK